MNGDFRALESRINRLELELSKARTEIRALTLRRAVPRVFYAAATATVLLASNSTPSAQGVASKVKAPFTVVDDKGVMIFQVRTTPTARGFALATANGAEVAFATANPDLTMFKVVGGGGVREAVIGVIPEYAGTSVRSNGKVRASLGFASDLMPILNLATTKGTSIVALRQSSDSGGGLLQLGDAAGNPMVKAGIDKEGVGVVQTAPLGLPGAGLVGMPGTFIRGLSGGK